MLGSRRHSPCRRRRHDSVRRRRRLVFLLVVLDLLTIHHQVFRGISR